MPLQLRSNEWAYGGAYLILQTNIERVLISLLIIKEFEVDISNSSK